MAEKACYEKHAERIRRQTEDLCGQRNAMVEENEQVRNDIKESTNQIMDDRGILIKQCTELKIQRGKLVAHLDELQQQIGDPNQFVDPNWQGTTGGDGALPPDQNTAVEQPPKSQVNVQFDPFVNDNASQNVNGRIYDKDHMQSTQSGTTGTVDPSDDDDYSYPNTTSGKVYYQGGPSGGSGDPSGGFPDRNPIGRYPDQSTDNAGGVYYRRQTKHKPARRSSMSEGMREIYDNNPCIAAMGMDSVSRTEDGTEVINWSMDQARMLRGDSKRAARRQACQPKEENKK